MTPPDWGLLSLCDTSSSTAGDPDRTGPDIVLVHGLGGGRVTTWGLEDDAIWDRDHLAMWMPGKRVFAFGYPGTLKSTSDSPMIRKIALKLLKLLEAERRQFPTFSRPIMWVGHGLGGLIIKKAIMQARYDSAFMPLFHLTFGVAFFSTPHHYLDRTLCSRMLMACKPPWIRLLDEPPAGLLNEVEGRLENMEREYEGLRGIRNVKFVSFLEGFKLSNLDDVIVTRQQGVLGGLPQDIERIHQLQRDYVSMCRVFNEETGGGSDAEAAVELPDREAGDFAAVAQLIEEGVTTSKKAAGFDRKGISSLEWLGISRIRPVRMTVEPARGTCNWITQTEAYENWKRSSSSSNNANGANMTRLWIRGPAGCGKTYLAKHIWVSRDLDMDLRHSPGDATAHCSVDDIILGRRTPESLLLCLTFDILMAQPWLIRQCLVPRYNSARAAGSGFGCNQGTAFIRDLWKDVITNAARESGCLVLIADGIDKCENPAQALQDLLDSVSEVSKLASDQKDAAEFQLLILSNRTEELDALANSDPDLLVHGISGESIAADMRLVLKPDVDAILSEHNEIEDSPLGQLLWDIILGGDEKSHGWAAILLSELKAFRRSRKDLVNLLGELTPGDFTALYEEILGRRILSGTTPSNNSLAIVTPIAQNLLFWITHQLGAMTKEELRIACAMSTEIGYPDGFPRDRSTGDLTIRHLESEPQPPTIDEEMFDEALRICAPLLRIASSSSSSDEQRFTVANDSLRGYLATIPPETSHEIVATVCMNYLLLPRRSATGSMPGWEAEVCQWITSYKFAGYAATRWVDHFTLASSSSIPPRTRENLNLLLSPGSDFLTPWTKVLWYHTKGREGEAYPMATELGSGGFPWASVFTWKQVEMIEGALRLASAAPSDEALNDPPEGGVGARGGSAVEERTLKRSGNVRDAFRGRRRRVMVLTLIIVVLVIVGGAVGGTQAAK